jgi:ribose transport system substrate-binding protein
LLPAIPDAQIVDQYKRGENVGKHAESLGRLHWVALFALLAMLLVVAGCGGGSSSSSTGGSSSGGSEGQSPVKIAFLAIGTGNTFVNASIKGAEAEAKKINAELEILNGEFNPETQLGQCQQVASAKQADAVVLFPVSGSALKPCGPEMEAAELPLVGESQPIGDSVTSLKPEVSGLVANVGVPLQELMEGLADSTVEACEGIDPCNIAWFRTISTLPQGDSVLNELLEKALEENPNMHVVAEADTGLEESDGEQQIRTFAQKTKDINVLLSYGAQSAVGAVKGLEEVGLHAGNSGSDVRIISNGASSVQIELLKKGEFYATPIELPESEGAESVKIAAAAARGEKYPSEYNPPKELGYPVVFNAKTINEFPEFKPQWQI